MSTPIASIRLPRTRLNAALLIVCSMLTLPAFAFSQAVNNNEIHWPERAGPFGDQSAPDGFPFPTKWSEAKGVAWKTTLPGAGHSTPVIGAGRIWLTTAAPDGTWQSLLCLNQSTGEMLREIQLWTNDDPEPLGNAINTYASPTCVLTPDAVYAHFGSYGTARVHPETGDVVWTRRDLECRHFRGPGSSPVLHENLLILTFDGIDRQYLTALDTETGATVWMTPRSTDYHDLDETGQPRSDGDYRKAYSTPGLREVDGRWQVISVGSRAAFGYDALTGAEIWTITHDDFNASARPIFHGDHVILNTGSRNANLVCIRLDETTRGNVDQTHVVWDRPKGNSDLSAPVLVGDRIFMIANNGVVTCVDAATGEDVWKDRLGGSFVATPITGGGLIYFPNEEGATAVIRAADQFELVARNELEHGMRSSPAYAQGGLFLRTMHALYSIHE